MTEDNCCRPDYLRGGLVTLLLFAGLSVGACNTISGAGEDIEAAGEAITEEAEDAKE